MWDKIKKLLHTHLFTCEIKVKCHRLGKDVNILEYSEDTDSTVLSYCRKEMGWLV